ncbi:2-dehydropantoate 2-reductase [Bacillus sp. AK031]
MKIGIIGGGAVGLLFAANLGKEFDVTLYVKRKEQEAVINNQGVSLKSASIQYPVSVKASINFEGIAENDLIIIAVKQYHLIGLKDTIKNIPHEIPLLFLQNGIGHLEMLKGLLNHHIYVGTVEHGSIKYNDNTVVHMGKGKTNAAVFRGNSEPLTMLMYRSSDFPFQLKPDYEIMLLEKLAVNAVINPLTAVLRVKNGQLVKNADFLSLAQSVFKEILLLFPQLKSVISFEDIKAIGSNTRGNTSSMLADIKAKRETEIDAILGVLVEKGKKEHLPLTLIPALYKMVKGLDNERGNN